MKKHIVLLLLSFYCIGNVQSQSLSLPYYTGFDSVSEQAGWQEFRLGVLSTFSWKCVSVGSFAYSPPISLLHEYNVGGSPTDTVDDWFVSPPFIFNTSAQLNLKILLSITEVIPPDYIGIWFSSGTSNPASGNFYELANLTNIQPFYQWLDTSITITTVTDSGYIAFRYNGTDNYFKIYIDNVIIIPDSNKGTIDSLKIIPSNPTTNDSIKIIGFTVFPVGDCFLKNYYLNINDKKIVINATHFEGGWTVMCNSIDTITIGKLDTGAYTLYYELSVDTNLAIFDTDTLFFVVQNPADVFDLSYETSQIKVYPNPANKNIRIEIAKGIVVKTIKLHDLNGKLIKTFLSTNTLLNISGIAKGQYMLSIETNNKIIREKIIIN